MNSITVLRQRLKTKSCTIGQVWLFVKKKKKKINEKNRTYTSQLYWNLKTDGTDTIQKTYEWTAQMTLK